MAVFVGWIDHGLAALAKPRDVDPFLNLPVWIGIHAESLPKGKEDQCDQAYQNGSAQPMRYHHERNYTVLRCSSHPPGLHCSTFRESIAIIRLGAIRAVRYLLPPLF